jgi:hypothetical protein
VNGATHGCGKICVGRSTISRRIRPHTDNHLTVSRIMRRRAERQKKLINLKVVFSVLAGRCWRTKNNLHFFEVNFHSDHHFLCFCLFFLSVPTDLVGKCCGRKWGVNLVNSLPKVHSKVR